MTIALSVLAAIVPASDPTPLTCDGHPAGFHVDRALELIADAHHHGRFLDATPARAREKRAWREHKLCLRDRGRRRRIARNVDRAQQDFAAYYEGLLDPPGRGYLAGLRACECRGLADPYGASTGNGYFGAYQFDYGTWASVGGSGSPAAAPAREQDYRAALLFQRRGSAPWPVCG